MTDLTVLREARAGRARREALARRARRRRRVLRAGLGAVAGLLALLVLMASGASGPAAHTAPGRSAPSAPGRSAGSNLAGGARTAAATVSRPPPRSGYGVALAPQPLHIKLALPVTSALLFDVDSGRVLWERASQRLLPIASLTKMMTALVVVAHARREARVLITRTAVDFSGSGVGLLPLGRAVPLETLLYGLMLPSGNDAAIALSQHVAGTQGTFIAMMNARARAMGLRCTHFTTVSGIVDQGNHSCAGDLAIIAHAVLEQPLLARIVGTRSAVLPFPIKGGKLYLYNNNPLLRLGYPGADGVKTGYTTAAGPCLVATARRGRRWLGVVLLHSANPSDQAQALLGAGFGAPRE
ncbi:MAG: D-alanyl-D-alanine carboxypeptidase family protein [Solirubrobacteraceae bacterium]